MQDVIMCLQKKAWHYTMAGSKRKKEVKQRKIPKGKHIAQGGDPERYYSENPAWAFANSDQEMWAFSREPVLRHLQNSAFAYNILFIDFYFYSCYA